MFDERETSEWDGEPRELYWFVRGSDSWYYTSSAIAIEFDGNEYLPLAGLSRSNIRENGGEASARQLNVTLPRESATAAQFIGVPHVQPLWLFVYRIHEGDTDYRITWQGRVRYAEFKGATAVMTLDNVLSSTKKAALRHLFQGQCNHFTFDLNCTLSEVDYSHDLEVEDISENLVTITSGQPDEYFLSGQIRRANGDRRFITNDTSSGFGVRVLELLTPFEDLDVGEEITVIGSPCRHTFDTCPVENKANYGGFPLVPRKNPFKSFK